MFCFTKLEVCTENTAFKKRFLCKKFWRINLTKTIFCKIVRSLKFVSNTRLNLWQKCTLSIILCLSVVHQNMRFTRRIVLPLLTKALLEFGCFEEILQEAKLALLLFYWVALTQFCMLSNFETSRRIFSKFCSIFKKAES